MNLSPRLVAHLREAGHEAVHWIDLGPPDAPDREIMNFAASGTYVVITHDLDFSAILAATGAAGPSVIQIRADNVSPEAIGAALIRTMLQLQKELERGALVTLDAARARLRVLPLATD